MQVGILYGKIEPDHPERNPARQEVTNVVKPGERRQQAVIRYAQGIYLFLCEHHRSVGGRVYIHVLGNK